MGGRIGIQCKNCGYSKRFQTGIGLMYSPGNVLDFSGGKSFLSNFIQSKKEIEKIRKLCEDKNTKLVDYGHDIFVCDNCGEYFGRFNIILSHSKGTYGIEYKCSKCNGNVKLYDGYSGKGSWRSKEYTFDGRKCPKCGQTTIECDPYSYILWD